MQISKDTKDKTKKNRQILSKNKKPNLAYFIYNFESVANCMYNGDD